MRRTSACALLWRFRHEMQELAERLTKLAAHVLKNAEVTPIKILDADGAIVASPYEC